MSIPVDRTELDGLKREAKTCDAQLDIMRAELDKETDDTARGVLQEAYEKKSIIFDGIVAKVDKAEREIEDRKSLIRKGLMEKLDRLSGVDPKAIELSGAGEAANREQHERIDLGVVREFIVGSKSVGQWPAKIRDQMFTRVMFKAGYETDAIKLPPRAISAILGPQYTSRIDAAKDVMSAYSQMEAKTSCSGTGDYSTMPYASNNAYMEAAAIWTEYKRRLLDLPGEPTNIIDRVTVVPSESGTAQWVRTTSTDALEHAGVVATWLTCEGDQKIATQVKFETFDISCFELQAYTEITDRALARSLVPIEQILNDKFRKAVNHSIETSILVGSGAGEPDGIVDVPGIHTVGRRCTLNVRCEDLIRMKYALQRQHLDPAMFAMQVNAAMDLELASLGTDCECVVRCFTESLAAGKAYTTTHRLPALGSAGDVILGDFSEYILAVEQDILLARSNVSGEMFRRNSTAFKVYMIVGGEVAQPRAFVQLDDCTYGVASCCCI